ncbi:uncharacterized protein DEA37_0004806, partial [Paragonimus westermani]
MVRGAFTVGCVFCVAVVVGGVDGSAASGRRGGAGRDGVHTGPDKPSASESETGVTSASDSHEVTGGGAHISDEHVSEPVVGGDVDRELMVHTEEPSERVDEETMLTGAGVTSSVSPDQLEKGPRTQDAHVRTLLDRCSATERPERRTALIAMELRRYGIDVAALSETRLADQGKLREAGAGYTFYWIGYPTDGVREHGVCFAVADRINGLMIGEPHGISPRMLSMRLRLGRGKCATFVSVYGPTMCHTDDTKDQFYDQLSATIRSAPVNDRLFVLGDLNARVGRDSVAWPGVLGPYGIGSVNANGDRLLHLCATHELAITNTRFQLDASDITTWTHPRSGHHHLLDYVIVRQRDIREVRITRVMRGAECSTDHRLVRTKLFIHVRKSVYCRSFGQRQKLDIRRLENFETKAAFQRAVVARLHNAPVPTTPEGMWQQLKKQIMVAATETIGVERKKRPDWFDDNNVAISNLVREKNAAFATCTMDPGNGAKKTRFRNIRRQLAERVRGIKDNWWRKQGERMQGFADRRQHKEFYDSLKAIFGPSIQSTKALVDVDTGCSCSQPEDIMGIWRKHFGSLLNRPTTIDWATVNSLPQQDVKSSLALAPDLLELQRAIGQLRNGKAAGEDGLPGEILKNGGPALERALLQLVHSIWEHEVMPQDFKDALIVPLFKGKGSKQCTDSYRGISLLSCAGKVLARILLNRLNASVLEMNVPEEQCGFRSSRSTIDLVFAARQLQEKCRERNQPLYALFVDFTKAFDSVNREALWTVLGKFGCPGKFVNMVRLLHAGMKAKVQSCGSTSDDFDIVTGVKQGCVLAPALFSLYLTAMVTVAFQNSGEDGVEVEYRTDGRLLNIRRFGASTRLQTSRMRMLLFADDSALLAHSEEELQRLATAFASAASKFGLDINTGKTYSFFQPSPGGGAACVPPPEIRIAGDTVNGCGDFCYLGSNLSTDLSVDRELRARVAKASAAFGRLERRVWKNHSLKMATKLCVYRSMVLSILLYGSETWTLYQRNVSYLSRFHVQCLRRILGIRWSDMIPNTEVLRRADMDGMEAMLMLNQLRWLGHVRRMGDDRIPKQLLYGQVKSGKRNPGGQKRRYQDVVQVSLSRCNIDFRCWEDLALNRTAWRNTVRAGVRAFNEQLLRGRERKRAVRKGTIGAIGRGDVTIWRCNVCCRECAGRLGLVGHQRTHSTPSAKRRR